MNFGNIQGLVNTVEQVVFDYEVTGSAVSSISTGNILNGNEDGWYTIISRYIPKTNGVGLSMRFNNDSGANYGTRGIAANNTTVSNSSSTGSTAATAGYCATAGRTSFLVARMYAKSGAVRLINSVWCFDITGTTCTELRTFGEVWNNSVDNITNINFVTAGTDIDIGTRIIILKSNNFTNGTPTGVITTPYIKGAWVRVGSQVLGSAASSVTFSGLDGDRDVVYYLKTIHKSSGGTVAPLLVINSDSGANYGLQVLSGNNITVAGARYTGESKLYLNSGGAATGRYSMSNTLIFAKKGFIRPVISCGVIGITGTTVDQVEVEGQVWNNTSSNITEFVIGASANNFDTGSQFDLYALRPNG